MLTVVERVTSGVVDKVISSTSKEWVPSNATSSTIVISAHTVSLFIVSFAIKIPPNRAGGMKSWSSSVGPKVQNIAIYVESNHFC